MADCPGKTEAFLARRSFEKRPVDSEVLVQSLCLGQFQQLEKEGTGDLFFDQALRFFEKTAASDGHPSQLVVLLCE